MKNLTVEGMTADWRTMTITKTTFLNESSLCFNNRHKLGSDLRWRYSFIDTDSSSVQLTPPRNCILIFEIKDERKESKYSEPFQTCDKLHIHVF